MTIGEHRIVLAEAVKGVKKIQRCYEDVPANLAPPCGVVQEADPFVTYDETFGGQCTYRYTVSVYVARSSNRAAQKFLNEIRAPSGDDSVKAALEADSVDTAIGGEVHVPSVSGIKVMGGDGEAQFLFVDFGVEVTV